MLLSTSMHVIIQIYACDRAPFLKKKHLKKYLSSRSLGYSRRPSAKSVGSSLIIEVVTRKNPFPVETMYVFVYVRYI